MRKTTVHSIASTRCIIIVLSLIGLSGTIANAQCFGSFANLAAAAAVSAKETAAELTPNAHTKPAGYKSTAAGPVTNGRSTPSIVGLWHVHYIFPNMDQEAYQSFETGGTEIHNPNTPTDGVCLGAWAGAPGNIVRLTHRVWLYDNGNFVGVGHLNATIYLLDRGDSQWGTFTMTIFDLSGNPLTTPIPGTLSGERVTLNQ